MPTKLMVLRRSIFSIGKCATIFLLFGFVLLNLVAVQANPGDTQWVFTAGGPINSAPAIGPGGWVIFGSSDRKVYALDGRTGEKQWEFATGGAVNADPAIGLDGTAYIGSADGHLYALDGYTGTKKWDLNCLQTGTSCGRAAPAIGPDGTVYVGGAKGVLYALDGVTGTQKWATATNINLLAGTPALGANGMIYVSTFKEIDPAGLTSRGIQALDAATGETKWVFEIQAIMDNGYIAMSLSPVIGSDGTVYFCSAQSVYALDGTTGKELWRALDSMSAQLFAAPALDNNGSLYVGSGWSVMDRFDGNVCALDAKTGLQKWSYETCDFTHSSPAIGADGTLYIGDDKGNFYALDAASGVREWGKRMGGSVGSPAVGADGTVYVGSEDGKLYALEGAAGLSSGPSPKYRNDARNSGSMLHIGAPVIMKFLTNQWVGIGFPYALEAMADGQPPLTYAWFYNGTRIEGAANSVLPFATFDVTNAGVYRVQVSNAFGSADSGEITLNPAVQIAVENDGPGKVEITPSTALVPMGTQITVTAQPDSGRRFLGWSGYLQDTNPVLQFAANTSVRLRASFGYQPGDLKWSLNPMIAPFVNTGMQVDSTGVLYVPVSSIRNPTVYALEGRTGAKKWNSRPISSLAQNHHLMLGPNDAVYAMASEGDFSALANATGAPQWYQKRYGFIGFGTDGTIYNYFSYYDNTFKLLTWVTAIDGLLGTQKWGYNSLPGSGLAVKDEVLYLLSGDLNDYSIYALNTANGNTNWLFHLSDSVYNPVFGNDGTFYFCSRDNKLYALKSLDGTKLWEKSFGTNLSSLLLVKDRLVYNITNHIQACDRLSGETLWEYAPTTGIYSSLVGGTANTVYFGGTDKKLHALDSLTGGLKWNSAVLAGLPETPIVGLDETLYLVINGTIYALEGDGGSLKPDSTNSIPGKPILILSQKQSLDELSTLSLTFRASGNISDPNAVRYSLVSAPEGVVLDAISGKMTWTPSATQGSSNYVVTVKLTDLGATNSSVEQSFSIEVREVNHAPELTTEPRFFTVESGQSLVFTNTAMDPDRDWRDNTLSFSLSTNMLDGAKLSFYQGVLSWTAPTVTHALTNVFAITVSDNGHPILSDTAEFTVVVVPPAPPLRFEQIQLTDSNRLSLTWASAPGARYQLQSTERLAPPAWTNLGDAITAQGETVTQGDPQAPSTQRFYRVVKLPVP